MQFYVTKLYKANHTTQNVKTKLMIHLLNYKILNKNICGMPAESLKQKKIFLDANIILVVQSHLSSIYNIHHTFTLKWEVNNKTISR